MHDLPTERYGKMLQNDILKFFLDQLIGEGTYRDVYEFAADKDLVVKIEARNGDDGKPHFCNVTEMDIWLNSEDTPWRKWLAQCVHIQLWIGPHSAPHAAMPER